MQHVWLFLDGWFFGPVAARRGWGAFALRMLRYPYAVVRDVTQGEISLRAMGLVYTTLLSVVPLIAFFLSVLSIFGLEEKLGPWVYELVKPLGEQGAELVTRDIMQFAGKAGSGAFGAIGFALLVWTAIGTISRVEDSFNFLWRITQARSFARRMVEYLTLLVIGPLLLISFYSLSQSAFSSAPVQEVARLPLLQRALTLGLPHLVVSAFFTVLYLLIPNTRVQLRAALLGGLLAGVLWVTVGRIFTTFVVLSTRTTFVYTGFASIIAALLWTYSSWLILLIGAQLSFYIQNPTYLRLGTRPLTLSSEDRDELALAVMYLVCHAHLRGEGLWQLPALAAELDVPGVALSRTAEALTRAGLLLTTEDGQLVPARDAGQIPVQDVLETARHQGGGQLRRTTRIPAVEQLLSGLDESRRTATAGLSLRDVIEAPRALVLTPRARPSRGG
jgi:membrane protein